MLEIVLWSSFSRKTAKMITTITIVVIMSLLIPKPPKSNNKFTVNASLLDMSAIRESVRCTILLNNVLVDIRLFAQGVFTSDRIKLFLTMNLASMLLCSDKCSLIRYLSVK